MMKSIAFTAFAIAFAVSGAAFAADPAAMAPTAKNGMFVDAKGMTLYTFDKDTAGKSACNGPCAKNWPPLLVADGAKASGDRRLATATSMFFRAKARARAWPTAPKPMIA